MSGGGGAEVRCRLHFRNIQVSFTAGLDGLMLLAMSFYALGDKYFDACYNIKMNDIILLQHTILCVVSTSAVLLKRIALCYYINLFLGQSTHVHTECNNIILPQCAPFVRIPGKPTLVMTFCITSRLKHLNKVPSLSLCP